MYSVDDEYLDNPSGSKTINISGNADSDELIKETRSPDGAGRVITSVEGVDEREDEKRINLQMQILR